MTGGRLPDGTTTKNNEEYVDAWMDFARPICEVTGLSLYGCDPGISLRTKEKYSRSVELPEWFVHLINKALTGV